MFKLRTDRAAGRRFDVLLGLVGFCVALTIWSTATYLEWIRPIFLPSPAQVIRSLYELQANRWLIPAICNSSARVAGALLIVVCVAVPLGVAMGAFPEVDGVFRRIISAGKSVPVTGLLGLIVLWFGVDGTAKIVFLVIGSFFYLVLLVRNAVLQVPREYLLIAIDLGANRMQCVLQVLLPGALPQIWDAITVCNGLMWTYIVLAEFINSNEDNIGLGYLIYIGGRTQNSGKVFAALILVAILSSLTDWFFQVVRRRYLRW